MYSLFVQGPEVDQAWSQPLVPDESVRIGRAVESPWCVPWDRMISREHADVCLRQGVLHVDCLDSARNAAEYRGVACRTLQVAPGETFSIGETRFRFESAHGGGTITSTAVSEYQYSRESLTAEDFRDAESRLHVLSELPSVLACATDDDAFAQALAELLLGGISKAANAAVLHCSREASDGNRPSSIMRWTSRDPRAQPVEPSRRLVRAALERGQAVLHVWSADDPAGQQYTMIGAQHDWAFCTPLSGNSGTGWCLYVTGRRSRRVQSEQDLAGDVRFATLLADVATAMRDVRTLEARQAGLLRFFSPSIVHMMRAGDANTLLEPRECDATVLFCDLRGFSRFAEQNQHDLRRVLDRSAEALGVMTDAILAEEGVIADFQGDAVLGFWGWPIASDDRCMPALRAALRITQAFDDACRIDGHPLQHMHVGIGIAHGPAIAGRIGSTAQAKVGVFGPVANLGSRLESLTKHVGVRVLADFGTIGEVDADKFTLRRIARVRPFGLAESVEVCAVEAPGDDNDRLRARHDEVRRHFDAGQWQQARQSLNQLPDDDGPRRFIEAIIGHHDVAPEGWDGIVVMKEK